MFNWIQYMLINFVLVYDVFRQNNVNLKKIIVVLLLYYHNLLRWVIILGKDKN